MVFMTVACGSVEMQMQVTFAGYGSDFGHAWFKTVCVTLGLFFNSSAPTDDGLGVI